MGTPVKLTEGSCPRMGERSPAMESSRDTGRLESWKRTEQWTDMEKIPYPAPGLISSDGKKFRRPQRRLLEARIFMSEQKRMEREAGISR